MKKKILVVVSIILVAAAVAASIAIASGKNDGEKEIVSYTADPVTGKVPASQIKEKTETPSFIEFMSEKLGKEEAASADILICFKTYSETGLSLSSASHKFDIYVPSGKGYSVEAAEAGINKFGGRWAESGISAFVPETGSLSSGTLVFNIVQDGRTVDTVRLTIGDAEGENGSARKEIVSCESQSLKVAYYNYDIISDMAGN